MTKITRQLAVVEREIQKLQQLLLAATIPCVECGRHYEATRKDQLYCSRACALPARLAAKRKWWNESRAGGRGK